MKTGSQQEQQTFLEVVKKRNVIKKKSHLFCPHRDPRFAKTKHH